MDKSGTEKQVTWMNYSGAPALFLPESLLQHWTGFFLPVDSSGEGVPDLELSDGRR